MGGAVRTGWFSQVNKGFQVCIILVSKLVFQDGNGLVSLFVLYFTLYLR